MGKVMMSVFSLQNGLTKIRQLETKPLVKTRSSPRKLRSVPEKRLTLYGVAAGAALAAGASQSDAALLTLDLTGLSLSTRTTPLNGSLYFDVNAGSAAAAVGTANFTGADFFLTNSHPTGTSKARINATGSAANGIAVIGTSQGPPKARQFTTSQNVSVGAPGFAPSAVKIGSSYGAGPKGLAPGSSTYLGLRFAIAPADIHYGWANITLNNDYTVTLNSLGYESVANAAAHVEPAVVPEPSVIALLALGAVGVAAFRNRQRKVA
jgi:hypothetical protein